MVLVYDFAAYGFRKWKRIDIWFILTGWEWNIIEYRTLNWTDSNSVPKTYSIQKPHFHFNLV